MAFVSVSGFVRRLCVSMCFPYFAKTEGDFSCCFFPAVYSKVISGVVLHLLHLSKVLIKASRICLAVFLSIGNPTFRWFTPPPPPPRNDPVGLKLRAVGLKMMRLFTCSALRSKLNIFETRDRLKLLSIELEICSNRSNCSEII